MIKKISVVGGDLRIVKLIQMLANDGFEINTYALEKIEDIEMVKKCETMEEALKNTQIVIGPIPVSSDNVYINTPFSDKKVTLDELSLKSKGKKIIAGSIKPEMYQLNMNNEIETIDILDREELAVLNAISTSEGAIQIAMDETKRTIHDSNILILGFGKTGKILAKMLDGIGANVYCQARENIDLAWIKAYGYHPIHQSELDKELSKYDIIMNTVPAMMLDEEKLKKVRNDCVIIDLASNPGGVDRNAAKQLGIKMIWALSLPGKVAPVTCAEFIKDTIYNIFTEI